MNVIFRRLFMDLVVSVRSRGELASACNVEKTSFGMNNKSVRDGDDDDEPFVVPGGDKRPKLTSTTRKLLGNIASLDKTILPFSVQQAL